MSKRNRNQSADQSVSAPNAADLPVSSDAPPSDVSDATEAKITITMEEFIGRTDRADWLSIADAAAYIGSDINAQQLRNAAGYRQEFSADGAKLLVTVPGYAIKPLTYLHRPAVDLYVANNAAGTTRSNTRSGGTRGKRWIIRLTADQEAAYRAGTLDTTTVALEVASAAHKPKADASQDQPSTDQSADQPSNGVDAVHADQSADQSADDAQEAFAQPWQHADA